jgi:hypothetical protein
MKLLSSIKTAAFLFALAALTPSIFAVSETYIPSNAKFALFVNTKKGLDSSALKTVLSRDGVDLGKSLDDVAMVLDDLTGDVSFFLTEIDPADFEKSLMDVVLYAPGRVNAIYDRLAARDDIKTEASTIPGARILKIHTKNGETDALAFFEFISDDIMQCRLAINLPDTMPFIWQVNPETPMMVTSMKTKGAIVSAAVDAAYVQGKLKAEEEANPRTPEEKKTKIKAGDSAIEIDEEDPSLEDIRNNVTAMFARITEGSRGSLDATITLRCTSSAIRDEVFQTVDGFVTLYSMLSSASFEIGKDGKLIQKGGGANPLSTLKHEPKGNDAVFTLNLSEEFLDDVAKSAAQNNKKNSSKKKKDSKNK